VKKIQKKRKEKKGSNLRLNSSRNKRDLDTDT